MESDKLYRVEKKDLPKLEELLLHCFRRDPLYETLIPDPDVRERLMPELFHCDIEEFFATCEIFSDSEELRGILVVSDEEKPRPLFHYLFSEVKAALATDSCLLKEDPSLQTLRNFHKGKEYLNSHWTEQLHQQKRLHIIYLAVDPRAQHHGIAALLMEEAIACAERAGEMLSLETHNPHNLEFYQKFGFEVYEVLEKEFSLKQYCLIRRTAGVEFSRPALTDGYRSPARNERAAEPPRGPLARLEAAAPKKHFV